MTILISNFLLEYDEAEMAAFIKRLNSIAAKEINDEKANFGKITCTKYDVPRSHQGFQKKWRAGKKNH